MSKNAILILGSAEISKASFVQKLTGTPVASNESVVAWTIDTKYYTCDVRLWMDTVETTTDPATINQFVASVGSAVDGLVLLFDSKAAPTFEAVIGWASFIDEVQPNVSLLIDVQALSTSPTESSPAAEALLDRASSWAAHQSAELVAAEEGEDAWLRVRQALEANAWGGLVMKAKGEQTRQTQQLEQHEIAVSAEDDSLHFVPAEKNWKKAAAAEFGDDEDDYLDLKGVLGREEESLAGLMAQIDMNTSDMNDDEFGAFMDGKLVPPILSVDQAVGREDFNLPEFDEFDAASASQEMRELRSALFGDVNDDEFFEKALSQIKSLRESGSDVSDGKRQEMARKLALALLCDDNDGADFDD
ncbi:hypothetical protein BDR26DRAFT_851637 [Obelidium mucronatum]|nr:hypothetical protein BDR26DRAFT_851637 [Obelidium mucronatum]